MESSVSTNVEAPEMTVQIQEEETAGSAGLGDVEAGGALGDSEAPAPGQIVVTMPTAPLPETASSSSSDSEATASSSSSDSEAIRDRYQIVGTVPPAPLAEIASSSSSDSEGFRTPLEPPLEEPPAAIYVSEGFRPPQEEDPMPALEEATSNLAGGNSSIDAANFDVEGGRDRLTPKASRGFPYPIFPIIVLVIVTIAAAVSIVLIGISKHKPEYSFSVRDVYKSRNTFLEHYQEMEEDMRVFVYRGGTERKPEGNSTSDIYFRYNLIKSRFRTLNAEEADLYFIPDPVTQAKKWMKPRDVISSYIHSDMGQEYWNRSLGTDHFMVTCADAEFALIERNTILKNVIQLSCSCTYSTSFRPRDHISFPKIVPKDSHAVNSLVRWKHRSKNILKPRILGLLEANQNQFLGEQLFNIFGKDPNFFILNRSIDPIERFEAIQNAKFCICLRDSPVTSSCMTESILDGCVPDHYHLPYSEILDWDTFSVIVKESKVNDMKKILMEISDSEFLLKTLNVRKVRKHFKWTQHTPARYDAFHMTLFSLWLRRHVIRY